MTEKKSAEQLADEKEQVFEGPFPDLELGDMIVLRELQKLDAMDLLNYLTHEEVHRFINEEDTPRNLREAEGEVHYWSGLFKHRRSIYWAIARKDTNQVIGTCGYNIWSRTHDRAEISYDLAYEYWGQGLMTSILRLIVKYGFEQMKLKRIQATVVLENKGSIRVLQKLGFKDEGILRKYNCLRGKYCDSRMMSILDEDYRRDKRYQTTGTWINRVIKLT
jgi:ribosomal-protein-alanine N-acetyltransferase